MNNEKIIFKLIITRLDKTKTDNKYDFRTICDIKLDGSSEHYFVLQRLGKIMQQILDNGDN